MPAPRARPPMLSSNDLFSLGRAYARFGADLCRTSLKIATGYAEVAIKGIERHDLDRQTFGEAAERFAQGLKSCSMEAATLLPFALERLSLDVERHVTGRPAEFRGRIGSIPRPHRSYVVQGKPMMLPARIGDASQGWALYFVSAVRAQEHLGSLADEFTVVDVGRKRTPIMIFGVDYRETDLGVYREIGVAAFVTPRGRTTDLPGMLFLSLTVDQEFTLEAARTIWGYHKTLAENLALDDEAGGLPEPEPGTTAARFSVDAHDPTALSISFPRFGSGRSTDIPSYTYSLLEAPAKRQVAHRTVFFRSGIDEGMQFGGGVKLRLGDGTQKRCVCRLDPGPQACVCNILRDLGLPKRPAANGWTERMTGTLEAPSPCGGSRAEPDRIADALHAPPARIQPSGNISE